MDDYQVYADKILRLTVRLEQLARGVSTDTKKELVKLQKQLISEFAQANGISTQKVLNAVKKKVKQLADARYKEIKKIFKDSSEATAEASMIAENSSFTALGVVADARVQKLPVEEILERSYMRIMPGIKGRNITVGDMVERFIETGVNEVKNITERAYREGLSVPAIISLIRESTGAQKRQAEGVARTSIQAVANQTRDDLADEYGFEKEIWLATLDSKTCAFCQGLDGKCKPKGKIPPAPAHPRCRCVKLYIPEGLSCSEMKNDLNRIERGEDGKSTPMGKYEDYGTWIKKQPLSFQQEVLGKERTRLLNEGKVTFNKMYTDIGKRKTVKSLKQHYEGAGKKTKVPKKSKLPKAKRLEDFLTPIATSTVPTGVNLPRISKKDKQSILDGFDNSIGKYKSKLNSVMWSAQSKQALASAHKKGHYISFKKQQIRKLDDVIKKDKDTHIKKKEENLDLFKNAIKQHEKGKIKLTANELSFCEEGIEKYKNCKRWAIYNDSTNPLRAIATHEGFHNVYRMNKLEIPFRNSLKRNNVTSLDMYQISEYGASSESEFFAEVGCAIEENISIPRNIKKAFDETVKGFEK